MTRPGLHIVTTVPQSLYALLAGQPRRLASTFDVTLIASPDAALRAVGEREGVATRGVAMTRSMTPIADLQALWRLYRWFRQQRPQIVQSYTPKGGLLAMTAARIAGVPVRVHGIVGMPLMVARGWRRQVLAIAERFTYAMSTHLICNSTGLRSWVEKHLTPRRPISLVAGGSINGVDLDHFAPAPLATREAKRRELGIGPETTVFAFLGRLVRDKGVTELLTAFDALRQAHRDVVLLVVGDQEPELDPLPTETVARLSAGAGVICLGWHDDIRPALAAADVCVLPSHREGLPNTLLEAGASGLPVIASDINGCNEVVEHGRTGILVPVGNAEALHQALCVLLDPETRRAMGSAARGRVADRFDHAEYCRALEEYYIEALNWSRQRAVRCRANESPTTSRVRSSRISTSMSDRSRTLASLDPRGGRWGRGRDGMRCRPKDRSDLVRFPTQPVVRVFSEVRLHRDQQGAVQAVDASSGAAAWDPYVERLGSVELAARVGPPSSTACQPIGRIGVYPLPYYSGPWHLLMRLPRVLRAIRAATSGNSLCVFRLPGTVSLIGAAWCRLLGRRYVVEVIGDPAGVLRLGGVLGPIGRLLAGPCGGWMRWAVAGAAAGHFVTEATLQALYPLGPGAVEHSYSDVRLTEDDLTPGPRSHPGPVRRLIAVGTHDQLYKGHDDLIRALALLTDRGFDIHLGLVGDGRHHNALRQLARTTGVADRVTFYGRVNTREDLRRMLDEADLFCMPSRTEGLPRALIEAMARGVPVVGTNAGGIPELIEPRFRTRPSDPEALAELIAGFVTGTADAAAASREAWRRAQHFTPSQQARRVVNWLDEIARIASGSP